MNVAICTPTTGVVKATYTASLLGMVGHYLRHAVPGREGEEQAMSYTLLIGSNIAQQREEMVQSAVSDTTVTHVLFIDDDMGFRDDCLNLALSRRKPVVLANYRKKTQPWSFTARRLEHEPRIRAVEVVTDEVTTGIAEISFGGFGFCLVEIAVLAKMQRPRFLPQWIEEQGLYSTEDYPFFKQIHDQGLEVLVDHDLSKRVIHVGDYAYQYGTAPFGVVVKKAAPAEVVQEYQAA